MKENEAGGACGKHEEEEKCIDSFGWEKWRKEITLKTKELM